MAKTPATPSKKSDTPKKPRFQQVRQMGEVFTITRQGDPSVVWRMLAAGLLGAGVWSGLGYLVGVKSLIGWIFWIPTAIFAGFVAALLVLARRARKAQYDMLEGQPGGASAVLHSIRRGWYTTPAVAVNRNQENVTRSVGRAGVVLVLEGTTPAAMQMLAAERKRTQRIIGEIPITDIVVGDGKDQVPLRKLERTVQKLPKVISQTEARELNMRLQAIQQAPVGIPKGPLPKGAKMPKMPKN